MIENIFKLILITIFSFLVSLFGYDKNNPGWWNGRGIAIFLVTWLITAGLFPW